jgi:protocatechuate 3,4-dioxygenase beta subunit
MLHLLACVLTLTSVGAAGPRDPPYTPQVGQIAQPQTTSSNNAPPAPNANTNNTPPPPGTATLRGHVFAADSGQPLRKAQVRIFAGDIRENRMATTDAEGRYEFKEVRAGRYTISANKGSYVGLSYGQQRTSDAPKPLQILDNQTVERVDLSLPQGGVITGRIVDEFGEPMSDVQIAPQTYQTIQGQRRLMPSGRQASTNDVGEFRLFGIPPGQYYLTATWRSNDPTNSEDKTAYAPMYFPGTDSIAQARRLTLAAGQQVSDIVMSLKPMRATRVSGTATTSDGRPMTGSIMVMSSGGFGFNMAAAGPIRPDGTFSVNGIAPGEYTLRAQSFGPAGPAASETATVTITAAGDDITDLRIVAAKPSTASGHIVVDPAIAASLPPALMIAPIPLEFGAMSMGTMPGRMSDDGAFELKSGPGKMRIVLAGPSTGWTIRSVHLNGSDVTDTGIEFKPNEDITGLEVEITNKLTIISGLVTNGRGETVKDYSAIAFSQDREKWKITGRYQGTGRPDQDGRFKISGLAPGDYYIIALDKIEQGQSSDPDFLEAIRTRATAITVHEGETRTVDLRISTGS